MALQNVIAMDEAITEPIGEAELTKWGITRQQTPYGLRIDIPPLGSWRHISRGYIVGFAFLALITLLSAVAAIVVRPFDPTPLISSAEYCIGAIAVGLIAMHLVQRHVVIAVTRDELAITMLSPSGASRQMSWSLTDVTEVKASNINGKLIIHSKDKDRDMAAIYLNPTRPVTHWIASTICDAIASPFAAPPTGEEFTPIGDPFTDVKLGHRLFRIALILAIIGVALLLIGLYAGAVVIVCGFAFVVVAAGITYGTQKKIWM